MCTDSIYVSIWKDSERLSAMRGKRALISIILIGLRQMDVGKSQTLAVKG